MVLKSGIVPQLGSRGCRTVLLCHRLTNYPAKWRSGVWSLRDTLCPRSTKCESPAGVRSVLISKLRGRLDEWLVLRLPEAIKPRAARLAGESSRMGTTVRSGSRL